MPVLREVIKIKTNSKPDSIISVIYMSLCAIFWSLSGVLLKFISWNYMIIAGFRALLAGIVLILYIKVKRKTIVFSKNTFYISGFLCANNFLIIAANKYTTAINAIILQYTAPIFVLAYLVVFQDKPLYFKDIMAILGTMSGIVLFFIDSLGAGHKLGNFLAILAGISFAGVIVSTSTKDENMRLSGLILGQFMTAVIGLSFLYLVKIELSKQNIIFMLILGIFQVGIPYILYNKAIEGCSPLSCSLIAALEPIMNPIWVYIFVGEKPKEKIISGALLVIMSIIMWYIWEHKKLKERQEIKKKEY